MVASTSGRNSPLSVRFTIAVSAIVLAAIGLLIVFALWAARTVDHDAFLRQADFVRASLRETIEAVPREQDSGIFWDLALTSVRMNDQAFMRDSLGEWMGEYFGHDAVYILDPKDRPIHAMRDLQTLPAQAYADQAALLAPLLAQLRAEIKRRGAGLTQSTPALVGLVVEDIVMTELGPAIVSLKPILPSTRAVFMAPGTEYVHIAMQRIDMAQFTRISHQYALDALHLVPAENGVLPENAVPVADNAGTVLAGVVWQADRPGLAMLQQAAPGFVPAIIIGVTLIGWLVLRLRKASEELQASEAHSQFLAFHDVLTGLPNRALFEERLERAGRNRSRRGTTYALHAVDIDRFKNINDTLGHAAGDELIRQVGARLTGLLRPSDTVARLGGDEFAVLQIGITNLSEAEALAERMLDALRAPFDLDGEKAFASASIGTVIATRGCAERDELMRRADIALYEAKGRGRNRHEVFAGNMDDLVKRRRVIERELRLALERGGQLHLVYQPIHDARSGAVLGAEALARWDHPSLGRLSPDVFIGVAEERGLIEPLGEWVLREACAFALRANLPWIAVNVSPMQFHNEGLPGTVARILAETGLPPERLQIEITEGVLLDNTGLTQASLQRLRDMGIRIALDDFGTGYSSMSYLRSYAVDKLKIDRSFIAQLGVSRDADSLVTAIVGLARSFRLGITAEGVETDFQRQALAALGCQELQGFLLSRPMDEADVLDLLAEKETPAKRRAAN